MTRLVLTMTTATSIGMLADITLASEMFHKQSFEVDKVEIEHLPGGVQIMNALDVGHALRLNDFVMKFDGAETIHVYDADDVPDESAALTTADLGLTVAQIAIAEDCLQARKRGGGNKFGRHHRGRRLDRFKSAADPGRHVKRPQPRVRIHADLPGMRADYA